MMLRISEIFPSIQGEGPNIGKSAVFIRTAECNLKCAWCDTKYTWDWKNYEYKKEVKVMTIVDAEYQIRKFGIPHLVITGGEPMLQQISLIPLVNALKRSNYYIEIETNGTVIPVTEMIGMIDQWNVSPKTSNSLNVEQMRENSICFEIFKRLDNTYFKFVVDHDEDIIEVENLISKYNLPKNRIILMPQASNRKELTDKINWVKKKATSNGYSSTTRLHIQLWDSKRGV